MARDKPGRRSRRRQPGTCSEGQRASAARRRSPTCRIRSKCFLIHSLLPGEAHARIRKTAYVFAGRGGASRRRRVCHAAKTGVPIPARRFDSSASATGTLRWTRRWYRPAARRLTLLCGLIDRRCRPLRSPMPRSPGLAGRREFNWRDEAARGAHGSRVFRRGSRGGRLCPSCTRMASGAARARPSWPVGSESTARSPPVRRSQSRRATD